MITKAQFAEKLYAYGDSIDALNHCLVGDRTMHRMQRDATLARLLSMYDELATKHGVDPDDVFDIIRRFVNVADIQEITRADADDRSELSSSARDAIDDVCAAINRRIADQ